MKYCLSPREILRTLIKIQNIKKVMESEDWKVFVNNHGNLVTIIMKAVVKRNELLVASLSDFD